VTIQVSRLNLWIDPVFDEMLGQATGVDLSVVNVQDPDDTNWAMLADTDIYHVSAAKDEVPLRWQVTSELLARCPRIKVVSSTGSGYDTIDVDACTRAGVLVVNQAGGNANSVAEHTIGLLLGVCRRIVESDHLIKTATGIVREDLMGRELAGQVIGIVGIGHAGTRVAQLAKAFGMSVLAYDPYVEGSAIRERGANPVTLDELLAQSDVVTLHCPRNAETMKMFSTAQFQKMKPRAVFISTARGGIHDEAALYEALASGHLGGAGLDVWAVEPPPHDHPLLGLPNVVSTYHTAGVTREARRNIARISAEQILQISAGARPPRMINPQVWPTVAHHFSPGTVGMDTTRA
jgi:Phosphoglycerate dehydrogenase and related dehydrogenases